MRNTKIVLFALTWFAYGLGVLPAADAAQPGAIYHYDYPAADRAALTTCVQDHGGTAGADGAWHGVTQDQLTACESATVWRGGKWNWDGRVLVSVEP